MAAVTMFSVGVLYSGQSLLKLVGDQMITVDLFRDSFRQFEVADASVVLELVQKCRWVNVSKEGTLQLTERGSVIVGADNEALCLREQLADLIAVEAPPWSKRILLGRAEAQPSMPVNAAQCFTACGLFGDCDDAVVEWWDLVAQSVRSKKSGFNLRTGRLAERLTITCEQCRTGREPKWQAIKSNVSGFDVLSVKEHDQGALLQIEVKGSIMRLKEASFFVTRNEWNTAINSENYEFHLWLLQQQPRLFVIGVDELSAHLPTNNGGGKWENVQLWYRDFTDKDIFLSTATLDLCRAIYETSLTRA